MNIQFDNFHTGDASLIETKGDNISLTFDHLWDKTGRQPILLAYFNGDFWKRADTGHSYTDIEISSTDVLIRPGDDDYDKIIASYANDEYGPDEY